MNGEWGLEIHTSILAGAQEAHKDQPAGTGCSMSFNRGLQLYVLWLSCNDIKM